MKNIKLMGRLIFPTIFVEQLDYMEGQQILFKKLKEAYDKINELEDRVEALENK